ncbi:hypothetical protein PG999_009997 [Apiospora kogelbergensis]|uniref:Small, acid-soluble spore protein, alpha/beta type n=1 Tax=Apiospora kogelbergensis TaxID=1337665 RepID=A0AAW0QML8_9PEZI
MPAWRREHRRPHPGRDPRDPRGREHLEALKEQAEQNLPSTSIREGLSINKMGNVVDRMGNHLGHIGR